MKLAAALGLVFAALGCTESRQLALTLLTPQLWSDGGRLDSNASFQVSIGWVGGDAGASSLGGGSGFSIPVPVDVPLDVEVSGVPSQVEVQGVLESGGIWRGELHGFVVPSGSEADAGILMLPVGQVGSFSSDSLPASLLGAAVAALDAGQVLVVGASDAGESAWIWDQTSVTFQPAPPTQLRWSRHSMTALGNGQFLLAGGDFAGQSTELYSLDDAGLVSPDALASPQLRPSIVQVDGETFIGCGLELDGGVTATDSVTDVGVSPLTVACEGGALLALPQGVLAVGTSGATLIDPSGSATSGPPVPRVRFAAATDGDGGVLVLGGLRLDAGASPPACSLVDDLTPGVRDTPLPALLHPRADHTVVDLGSTLLLVGGIDESSAARKDLEVFPKPGLAPDVVPRTIALGTARVHPAAIQVPGYRIVLILSGEMNAAGAPASGIDFYAVP